MYHQLSNEWSVNSRINVITSVSEISNNEKESEIREFWKSSQISEKISKLRKSNEVFTLNSGPPFATGSPHYGHLLNIALKITEVFNQSALGMRVNMPFGYDCHGLPTEQRIEQILRETSKSISTDKYIKTGVKLVSDYISTWDKWTNKLLSPVGISKSYKTMDFDYMRSVLEQFLQINKNGHISRKYMVLPFSTQFSTPLSNSEATENYKEISCNSIYIKFKLVNKLPPVFTNLVNIYALVWTTTPWTLPANMALCVHPTFEYSILKVENEYFVCAKSVLEDGYFFNEVKFEIIGNIMGSELVNIEYEPIFDFIPSHNYKITSDEYVQDDSGTGIVHIAPAHGEDDLRICIKNNICTHDSIFICVNPDGTYNKQFSPYENQSVFESSDKIITDLGNTIFKTYKIKHRIAFCPRSDTQLLSLVSREWFLTVSDSSFKSKLHERSSYVEWCPEQSGLKYSIENSPDWCLSRDRTFGPPLPVWISDDGDELCIPQSITEIEAQYRIQYNEEISSLYLNELQKITFPSNQGKGNLKLCNKVFDCWFESACMPNAINGYPFKTTQFAEPVNLVIEGKDQVTRGWFIKQLILSIALGAPIPFKKVVAHGFVLAEDGQKMSKRLQNYPDPNELEKEYGLEVILMYLKSSTAIKGESMNFCEKDLKEIVRSIHIPLRNAVKLLCDNIRFYKSCDTHGNKSDEIVYVSTADNIMDSWILKEILQFKKEFIENMTLFKYDLIFKCTQRFVHLLTNVYIKLNRPRLSGQCTQEDFKNSLSILKTVVYYFTVCFRTFAPYLCEEIYQKVGNIHRVESVMLTTYDMIPDIINDSFGINSYELILMFQEITGQLLKERDQKHIQLIKTLKQITIILPNMYLTKMMRKYFSSYFKISLNVTTIDFYYKKINPDHLVEFDFNWQQDTGKKYGRISKKLVAHIQSNLQDTIKNGMIEYNGIQFVIGEEIKINQKMSDDWIKLSNSEYFTYHVDCILDEYAYTIGLITKKIQEFRAELSLHRWNKIKIHLTSLDLQMNEFLLKTIGDYSKLQETTIVIDNWWVTHVSYKIKHVVINDLFGKKYFRIGIEYL